MTTPELPPLPPRNGWLPKQHGLEDAYTTDQMRAYAAAAVAAERERCALIVEEYSPGSIGSYHIRTVLAAAIRGDKP